MRRLFLYIEILYLLYERFDDILELLRICQACCVPCVVHEQRLGIVECFLVFVSCQLIVVAVNLGVCAVFLHHLHGRFHIPFQIVVASPHRECDAVVAEVLSLATFSLFLWHEHIEVFHLVAISQVVIGAYFCMVDFVLHSLQLHLFLWSQLVGRHGFDAVDRIGLVGILFFLVAVEAWYLPFVRITSDVCLCVRLLAALLARCSYEQHDEEQDDVSHLFSRYSHCWLIVI